MRKTDESSKAPYVPLPMLIIAKVFDHLAEQETSAEEQQKLREQAEHIRERVLRAHPDSAQREPGQTGGRHEGGKNASVAAQALTRGAGAHAVLGGLDPASIAKGAELVSLYLEAGTPTFLPMLQDFAESTGLSLHQAQAPLRAAYNYLRDSRELAGEDISGMDDAGAVLAVVRQVLANKN